MGNFPTQKKEAKGIYKYKLRVSLLFTVVALILVLHRELFSEYI